MFDCIERIISVPTAFTACAVPISFETCARPWLPIGGTMIGNGNLWPRIVVVRSGFSTPERKCGSIGIASIARRFSRLVYSAPEPPKM